MFFGDWWQLPPIPDSWALFQPPTCAKSAFQRAALDIFWDDGPNSLNFLAELTIQKRVEDPWYASLLTECRNGNLSHENYCFLCGLPTLHAGSWYRSDDGTETMLCQKEECCKLPEIWTKLLKEGRSWYEVQLLECESCKQHRDNRNRLVATGDTRVTQAPFLESPYVHKNNDPKYHALLLRAVEHAKRNVTGPKQILWFQAQDTILNPAEVAATEAELEQKLRRFLQYNDQKTAGIPGLFPLYHDMNVRITEKLAKNHKVTMLKHSPCKVVGWLLHPDDRETTSASQRRLNHLPLCIYIKFPNATWQVLPDMEPGVFPLKPVDRQWDINAKTGTKARRKGYTLLPDYASTSHLIQGETLEAELAECGDVFDTPPLKDMLSAYVVLSRVKRAVGLLLLRAFSLYLFRHGPPPGPHCLMKLLREKLTKTDNAAEYTQSDAKAEFASLQATRTEERERRKQVGVVWPCFDCQKEYPTEVYCGTTTNAERKYQDCVAHGHWRACPACQLAQTRLQGTTMEAGAEQLCNKCGTSKDPHYFELDSESCMACEFEEKYIFVRCAKCKNFKYKIDCAPAFAEDGQEEDMICGQCCPDGQKIDCHICKQTKLKSHFPRDHYKSSECQRCKDCHVCQGPDCVEKFAAAGLEPQKIAAKDLAPFAPYCKACYKKTTKTETPTTHPCAVPACQKDLPFCDFNENILHHAIFGTQVAVCKICESKGYSPTDTFSYECEADTKHVAGHKRFGKYMLRDWKRGHSKHLLCLSCVESAVTKKQKTEEQKTPKRKHTDEDS